MRHLIVAMLAGLVALTGCAPKSRKVAVDYTPMASIEGLELDESQGPALIWVRPGAASFASYDRFIIDPARIDYRDPNMAELSPEDVAKLQERFQDALVKQLRDGGYEVGTKSLAGTMRISFTISLRLETTGLAAGIRAKRENSLTMFFISSTCLIMVLIHSSKTLPSCSKLSRYLF